MTGFAGSPGATDGRNGSARFFNPYGLAVSPDGSLVVADVYNELIRVVLVPFKVVIQVSSDRRGVSISWDAVIGRKYLVQYSDGPDSAAWSNASLPITATSRNASYLDNTLGARAQRIYRVVMVQ